MASANLSRTFNRRNRDTTTGSPLVTHRVGLNQFVIVHSGFGVLLLHLAFSWTPSFGNHVRIVRVHFIIWVNEDTSAGWAYPCRHFWYRWIDQLHRYSFRLYWMRSLSIGLFTISIVLQVFHQYSVNGVQNWVNRLSTSWSTMWSQRYHHGRITLHLSWVNLSTGLFVCVKSETWLRSICTSNFSVLGPRFAYSILRRYQTRRYHLYLMMARVRHEWPRLVRWSIIINDR